ncbi:TRAP transporter substrate-binding protein [Anaerobacillus sp. MEB173]|uniref:TRAP transporter substrate-binding protein n=1 Tax=Anaerobacillus sp. MEB173 TaxID=3383345 RepID=UPI003F8E7C04
MKKLNMFIFLFIIMVISTACGNEETSSSEKAPNEEESNVETYVLKAVSTYPSGSVPIQILEKYGEELQTRSEGRLTLEIYPGSQLMPAAQEIPSVLSGQVDMALTASTTIQGFESSYYIFDLPMAFNHEKDDVNIFINEAREYFNSEHGGKKIDSLMEEKGIKVLSNTLGDGPGILFMSSENLITDVESAKGKNIRVSDGQIAPEIFRAINANGISVPSVELHPALQQGIVDGALVPAMFAHDVKLPIDSATVVPLLQYVLPIVISNEKFESLPTDLQEIIVQVGKDIEVFSDEFVAERYNKIVGELESNDVHFYYPTTEELEEWRAALSPVWSKFTEIVDNGEELIDGLNKSLEDIRN